MGSHLALHPSIADGAARRAPVRAHQSVGNCFTFYSVRSRRSAGRERAIILCERDKHYLSAEIRPAFPMQKPVKTIFAGARFRDPFVISFCSVDKFRSLPLLSYNIVSNLQREFQAEVNIHDYHYFQQS